MKYILTNRALVSSARLLSQELGIRLSEQPLENPPVIRWGCSLGYYKGDTQYNSPHHIHYSRRDMLSEILTEASVPHVELHESREIPDHYPVFARTVLNGMGGDGIKIVKSKEELAGAAWSYWRHFSFELGVHIFNGKVVKIFKKIWTGPEDEPPYPIRNADRGYKFKKVSLESFPKLQPAVDRFYRAFPIGFARLDIGWDIENKIYRIIECNSAPALSDNHNTLALYAENLRGVI